MCDHVGTEHAWRIFDVAIAGDHLLKADATQSEASQQDEEKGINRDSPAPEPFHATHFDESQVSPCDVCWILSLRELQGVFSFIINLVSTKAVSTLSAHEIHHELVLKATLTRHFMILGALFKPFLYLVSRQIKRSLFVFERFRRIFSRIEDDMSKARYHETVKLIDLSFCNLIFDSLNIVLIV